MSAMSAADLMFGGEPSLDSQPLQVVEATVPSVPGNVCTWRAPMVSLYSGDLVPSDSLEWQQQCECNYILAMSYPKREEFYETCERRRGEEAVKALKRRIYDIEPFYVLGLPNKALRNDYLSKVERRYGQNAFDALREKVLAIHRHRQSLAVQVPQVA